MFLQLLLLIFIAFFPSLVYMYHIRNAEKYAREPWGKVLLMFAWGCGVAVVIAVVIEYSMMSFVREYYAKSLVLALVIAPIAEEFAKPLGIKHTRILEIEDGIIYGAACGLGFAATENLLYESAAYIYGAKMFIATVFVRTISSTLLHASATAITGYGVGKMIIGKKPAITVLPYFLLAVFMHSLFNFFASLGSLLGLALAVIFAIVSIEYIRRIIERLDAATMPWKGT